MKRRMLNSVLRVSAWRKQVGNISVKAKKARTGGAEKAQLEGKRMEKGKGPPSGGKALTMEDMPSIVATVVKAMKEGSTTDNDDDLPSEETPPGLVSLYLKYTCNG